MLLQFTKVTVPSSTQKHGGVLLTDEDFHTELMTKSDLQGTASDALKKESLSFVVVNSTSLPSGTTTVDSVD